MRKGKEYNLVTSSHELCLDFAAATGVWPVKDQLTTCGSLRHASALLRAMIKKVCLLAQVQLSPGHYVMFAPWCPLTKLGLTHWPAVSGRSNF